MISEVKDLDGYLRTYGPLLSEQAKVAMRPLHMPGVDPELDYSEFKRSPYEAQMYFSTALVKSLGRDRAVMGIGEMGVGKTICAMMAVHQKAAGRNYRALVFCPGQLCEKWQREILETIPGARVTIIEGWKHLSRIHAKAKASPPRPCPDWFIIGRDRAKLGAEWKPVALQRSYTRQKLGDRLRCPKCCRVLATEKGVPILMEDLAKRQLSCPGDIKNNIPCGEQLWSYVGKQSHNLDRWEPARYIHKRMKHWFHYLILDEAHEEKSADSAQGQAAGSLAASCGWTIALTGTLIGGYAEHVRPLMFRLAPRSLIDEGMKWGSPMPFIRKYGRIETTITTKEGSGNYSRGRQSRSSAGRQKNERMRPGIMPTLFGQHLINKSVYLSLAEVSAHLPPYREIVLGCELDPEIKREYKRIEKALTDANKELVAKGNKGLLGAMLQCLLCYPDLQEGWEWVGYNDRTTGEKKFIPVVLPRNFTDQTVIRPKEAKLIELVKKERAAGRQCWVFVQYTDKRNVLDRLVGILSDAGLDVGVLRSSVPVAKREQWIQEKGRQYEVIVSHPKLVETGLDLFDKRPGGCNFCSLIWYETGYNLFTLRQASRRAWRIGQKKDCRVYFLYYEETAQAAAMALMGKKLHASQALEGKFCADGLVAMGGDDTTVEMALAQTLNETLPGDAIRAWASAADTAPPDDVEAEDEYGDIEWNAEDDEELDKLFAKIDEMDGFDTAELGLDDL